MSDAQNAPKKRGRPFVSGDPRAGRNGGRPPIPVDVKEALRAACPRAVERLVELLESPEERVALAAAQTVIERSLGRVPQSLDPLDELSDADAIAQAKARLAAV